MCKLKKTAETPFQKSQYAAEPTRSIARRRLASVPPPGSPLNRATLERSQRATPTSTRSGNAQRSLVSINRALRCSTPRFPRAPDPPAISAGRALLRAMPALMDAPPLRASGNQPCTRWRALINPAHGPAGRTDTSTENVKRPFSMTSLAQQERRRTSLLTSHPFHFPISLAGRTDTTLLPRLFVGREQKKTAKGVRLRRARRGPGLRRENRATLPPSTSAEAQGYVRRAP